MLLSAREVLSRHVKLCVRMSLSPNLDFYSVFTNILRAKDIKNMEISRHVGVGDFETHTHITASRT